MNFEITRWPPARIHVPGVVATDPQPDVFRLFLSKVLGRTRTLAASTFVGALLIGGISPLFPPSYEATSEIFVDPRGFGMESNVVLDANAAVNFIESQMRLISSDKVLSEVLRNEEANAPAEAEPAASIGDHFSNIKGWLGFASETTAQHPPASEGAAAAPARTDEDFSRDLEDLRSALSVERFDRSFVANVTVEDMSRHRAADRANQIVAAFLAEAAKNRMAVKQAGRLFDIDRRIALAEAEMLGRAATLGEAHPEVRRLKQGVDGLKRQRRDSILAAPETGEAQSLENAFLRVISPARPPKEKSAIKRAVLWTGVGAVLGALLVLGYFAFTCATTMLANYVTTDVRTASETSEGNKAEDGETQPK